MTAWLESVRLATTGNLADNGGAPPRPLTPATLDGMTVLVGNEILVKDQSDPTQNGTWTATSPAGTAMTRRETSFVPEATVRVSEGDKNSHTQWALKAPASAITVGTDPLPFLRQDTTRYTFDSLSAMKSFVTALPPSAVSATNATAVTAGYAVPGDDGGDEFAFIGAADAVSVTSAVPVSVSITAVSTAGTVVSITTSASHGLGDLSSVHIEGTLTNVPSGPYLVKSTGLTTFDLVQGISGAAIGGGGAVHYVSITTAAAHGRVPGQAVVVSGVVASGGAVPINESVPLGGVIDDTTISMPILTTGGTYTPGTNAVVGDDAILFPATDDAGTLGGVWKRINVTVLNVKAFGAISYDTEAEARAGVDSSAAFQAAFDALGELGNTTGGASRGGELVIPLGFYYITSPLFVRRTGHIRGVGTAGTF